jgi:hypothetical protein
MLDGTLSQSSHSPLIAPARLLRRRGGFGLGFSGIKSQNRNPSPLSIMTGTTAAKARARSYATTRERRLSC